jgi:hypothetical protein
MGHERVGTLPKTRAWKVVVGQIASFTPAKSNISDITQQTLQNVRGRFESIEIDSGVLSSFEFLVLMAFASQEQNPVQYLKTKGIQLPENLTPLQLSKELSKWVSKNADSNEYAAFAQGAAVDAVSEWYKKNESNQADLFSTEKDPIDVWRKSSNGSGFCELSRLYFSKFTERYLKYFLEREASSRIKNIDDRNTFDAQIRSHVKDISEHAFETSKITQSFAAGWFNNQLKKGSPSRKSIQGFLSIAFGKMKSELLREEDRK